MKLEALQEELLRRSEVGDMRRGQVPRRQDDEDVVEIGVFLT